MAGCLAAGDLLYSYELVVMAAQGYAGQAQRAASALRLRTLPDRRLGTRVIVRIPQLLRMHEAVLMFNAAVGSYISVELSRHTSIVAHICLIVVDRNIYSRTS